MTRIAAIVLAAGRSSRMGEFKPLLPLGEATVIERVVGSFLEAGVDDVRVVVGWRGDEVAAAATQRGAAIVVNHAWRRGMFSSVAAGVASLEADVEAFFLLPADCALVRTETIGRLARAALARPATSVVYPVHGGQRGHPPLIARCALPADLSVEPPDGLRGVLAAYDAAARDVEVDDPGVLLDMDEPSGYRHACEYVEGERVPDAARCLALLAAAGVPQAVAAHSQAVARVAAALAVRLNERGLHLNVRLVEAAGLLHDIARSTPDHAAVGAALLCDLGCRRVAAVVANHMDLPGEAEELPGEAEILYLSDKLVAGTQIVALQDRLARRLDDPCIELEGKAHARARLTRAIEVAGSVERLIGEPAETVARRALVALCGGAMEHS